MTKVMNVAMIGGGFMGKAHAMAYAAMPMFFWPAPAIPHRKVVVDMTDGAAETARARQHTPAHPWLPRNLGTGLFLSGET